MFFAKMGHLLSYRVAFIYRDACPTSLLDGRDDGVCVCRLSIGYELVL